MHKKLLFISHKAPYGSFAAKEALDAVLASAAFGQDISLLFKGDGVYQLLPQQNAPLLERKNIGAILGALELYEVKKVFVCEQSLLERGLKNIKPVIEVHALDSPSLQILLSEQDHILSF
jgi:tRNA 2-thiouridine synthesizing protein C